MSPTPARPATLPPAWSGPVATWRAHLLERGTAPASVDGYARHVAWLAADLGPHGPSPWTLTPEDLSAWLHAQNWSHHTRRKALGSLRNFYGWALTEGRARRSPLAGIPVLPKRTRGPAKITAPPLWTEPLANYLRHLEAAARAPGTIQQRHWWLIRLAETYADPWTITAEDLARFLSREDWQAETKRAGRATLRGFYGWAVEAGHVTTSPAHTLASVRLRRALPRPAPDDALRAALAHCDDRTRLALLLAAYAGLRRAEIAGLHTRDIGPEHLRVSGKGGHERFVPLHPELGNALRAEIRRRLHAEPPGSGWTTPPTAPGWIFPSDDPARHLTPSHLGKIITAALPDEWTTHTLRHRFATRAYRTGRDLRAVQELLGHAKPETTARYAAVPDGALVAAVHGVAL